MSDSIKALMIAVSLLLAACETEPEGTSGHCSINTTRSWLIDQGEVQTAWEEETATYFYTVDVPIESVMVDECESETLVFDEFEPIDIYRNDTDIFFDYETAFVLEELPVGEEVPSSLGKCQSFWTGYTYTLDFASRSFVREDTWYFPTSCDCDPPVRRGSEKCNDSKWNS